MSADSTAIAAEELKQRATRILSEKLVTLTSPLSTKMSDGGSGALFREEWCESVRTTLLKLSKTNANIAAIIALFGGIEPTVNSLWAASRASMTMSEMKLAAKSKPSEAESGEELAESLNPLEAMKDWRKSLTDLLHALKSQYANDSSSVRLSDWLPVIGTKWRRELKAMTRFNSIRKLHSKISELMCVLLFSADALSKLTKESMEIWNYQVYSLIKMVVSEAQDRQARYGGDKDKDDNDENENECKSIVCVESLLWLTQLRQLIAALADYQSSSTSAITMDADQWILIKQTFQHQLNQLLETRANELKLIDRKIIQKSMLIHQFVFVLIGF